MAVCSSAAEEGVVAEEFAEDEFAEGPSTIEVLGTSENFERYGSPSLRSNEVEITYVLYPTLRSQWGTMTAFVFTLLLSLEISALLPWTILHGKLFRIGSGALYLDLPLATILPAILLIRILIRNYDSKYFIDSRGVEAQVGLLSAALRQPRLRYEDIRGVEPYQTISDRIFGIGDLEIGSAMKEEVEIVMEGIADPRAVQLFIGAEIEAHFERAGQGSTRLDIERGD